MGKFLFVDVSCLDQGSSAFYLHFVACSHEYVRSAPCLMVFKSETTYCLS